MNDEDLTGPSRLGWQLIGLGVLLVVIVVYGVAPWLAAPEVPYTSGVTQVEHLTINGADVTIYPPGTVCRDSHGVVLKPQNVRVIEGMQVSDSPKDAVCIP
jgi:hypothetical protein